MFIRWKRYSSKQFGKGRRAVVVENRREGAKVKQKHIAHIGSILDTELKYPHHRQRFWNDALTALQKLGLDEEGRWRLYRQFEDKVPRPPEENGDEWWEQCRIAFFDEVRDIERRYAEREALPREDRDKVPWSRDLSVWCWEVRERDYYWSMVWFGGVRPVRSGALSPDDWLWHHHWPSVKHGLITRWTNGTGEPVWPSMELPADGEAPPAPKPTTTSMAGALLGTGVVSKPFTNCEQHICECG